MRIGIVGAENSHAAAVSKTLNVDKACGDVQVVAIWGETDEFAKATAEKGMIPEIVKRPEEMIGKIDGVMVDHRHAKYHVPAVTPFIEAKIPAFVDKPFCYRVREGVALLKLARKKGVPVTTFSTIPLQSGFRNDLMRQIAAAGKITSITTTGPCDLKSQWGGIFFYGIHQIDGILKAFGPGIEAVQVIKAGRGNLNAVAVMTYRNGGPIVSMECVAQGKAGFVFRAVGTEGTVNHAYQSDPNPYLTGVQTFVDMFKTGKMPFSPAQMLEPIAVLEALEKSVKTGKREKVGRVPVR